MAFWPQTSRFSFERDFTLVVKIKQNANFLSISFLLKLARFCRNKITKTFQPDRKRTVAFSHLRQILGYVSKLFKKNLFKEN